MTPADKIKFTDGQTDGRTYTGNENTPFRLKGHGVKIDKQSRFILKAFFF